MNELNISNISHNSLRNTQDKNITENIKVFSSNVLGLGKSFKLKNDKRTKTNILLFCIRRNVDKKIYL